MIKRENYSSQYLNENILRKSPAKQNKNKQIARHRDRNREREPELTHLFKNNSFNISLYREFLYTSHAGFFLHILSWLPLLYLGSIPHTSRAAVIFIWGVSLTHPMLALFFCGEFLLHIPCWLFCFLFFCFKSREFLLPIPCWLCFSYTSRTGFFFFFFFFFFLNLGRFSYTSHAGFIYKWGGVFLHIPYWLYFYLGSFSYTSHACFLCGEFLLHITCWLFFFLSLMWGETQA